MKVVTIHTKTGTVEFPSVKFVSIEKSFVIVQLENGDKNSFPLRVVERVEELHQ